MGIQICNCTDYKFGNIQKDEATVSVMWMRHAFVCVCLIGTRTYPALTDVRLILCHHVENVTSSRNLPSNGWRPRWSIKAIKGVSNQWGLKPTLFSAVSAHILLRAGRDADLDQLTSQIGKFRDWRYDMQSNKRRGTDMGMQLLSILLQGGYSWYHTPMFRSDVAVLG